MKHLLQQTEVIWTLRRIKGVMVVIQELTVMRGPGRIAMASVFRRPPLSPPPMNDSGATYQSG